MADPSTFPGASGASPEATAQRGRRSLSEPVLTSAEDELDMDLPSHDTGTSYTGGSGLARASGGSPDVWWMRLQDQVSQYVSRQPGRAALMALGAGALAAWLMGQRSRQRRRRD